MLTFREPGGALRVREQVRETQVSPAGVVRSTWSVWPDVEIETAMWAAAPWHYRVHTIRTGRYVETRETGFAVPHSGEDAPGPEPVVETSPGRVAVCVEVATGAIVDLLADRHSEVVTAWPNTNVWAPRTLIPSLVAALEPGAHRLGCAVLGAGYGTRHGTRPEEIVPPPLPEDVGGELGL